MSPKKKIEVETEESEGWESLAEESEKSLPASPELEAALAEAAAAVEAYEKAEAAPGDEAPPAPRPPPEEPGEGAEETALELKQTQDRLVRLQADFENFRRRATKERTEANQYGHQNLVKDLLGTVDNLDRAIDHARKSGGGDLESLLQGVELVQRELLGALTKHGVVRIEAHGELFDPEFHEAMAQMADDSVAPHTVIEEMQKGYKLRDRLLRPSRVVVAKPSEADATGDGAEQEPTQDEEFTPDAEATEDVAATDEGELD